MTPDELIARDALSAYDHFYVALSDTQRINIESAIAAVIQKSCDNVDGFLKQQVSKAIEQMYSEIIARPFSAVIRENASGYEMFSQVIDVVLEQLENNDPKKPGRQYCVERLFKVWIAKFPDSVKEIADKVLLEENVKRNRNY